MSRRFATMGRVRSAGTDAMQQVEGISTEKAPVIVAEHADLASLIDELAAAGVNMTEPGAIPPTPTDGGTAAACDAEVAGAAGGPPPGMTVVVTGAMTGVLEKLSRSQLNDLIERAGFKRAKAEAHGIRLATPDEFAALVADFTGCPEGCATARHSQGRRPGTPHDGDRSWRPSCAASSSVKPAQ